jgi:MFS family permease
MLYSILALALQVVGFVFLCRVGARLSDRLSRRSKWAPLAVAGPIIVGAVIIALVVQPQITFLVQTFGLWLVAFAGGIVARAQQTYRG